MEFLRFGSSIPGAYYGCCDMDIIQNFQMDPDEKSSIQIVHGDSGSPEMGPGNSFKFAGPTYHEIFKNRIRFGTFSSRDMPNHGFIAILTEYQLNGGVGAKWMKILKEEGFEFLRTLDNSVYTGETTITEAGKQEGGSHKNHVFVLFRNIGRGAVEDPYQPPKAWADLPSVVPEAANYIDFVGGTRALNVANQKFQLARWKAGKTVFLTEAEVIAAGAPVVYAGLRSTNPQEMKVVRDKRNTLQAASKAKSDQMAGEAFPVATLVSA